MADNDFDWILYTGSTPTASTGPSIDHTTSSSDGISIKSHLNLLHFLINQFERLLHLRRGVASCFTRLQSQTDQ